MKKFKFIKDGEEMTTPNDCESVTERTGRDEEFVFRSLGCYDGPIDFSPLECMSPSEGIDPFEWLPDQFDAIFCGIEYEMMIFQYGPYRISTPVQDKVKELKHGDLVTMKIR